MGMNRDTLSRESVAFTIISLGWPSASMIIVVEATTVAVTASVPSLRLPLDCAITEVNVSRRTAEIIEDLTLLSDPAFKTPSLNVFILGIFAFKQPRPITRATRT